MKHIASITTLTLVAAAGFADAAAPAAAPASAWSQSANLGFTTDYIFRGVSQNGGRAAVQGGFDVAHTSGLSAGVWGSSLTAGTEVDLYANYGFKVAGIDLSVGYIDYTYTAGTNTEEVNVGATYLGVNAKISKDLSSGRKFYYELNYTYSIPAVKGLDLGLHYGFADQKSSKANEDYTVALSYPVNGFVATVSYSNTPGYSGSYVADSASTTAFSLKKTF